ncbi:Uncharacterised protein [Sphingobacterium mizutaii]|uniref:Uncharacterized protein n=1 Tax=Sphingobacterium mizutaii TaxID=1010 RepID=A0AAJ4XCH8_9SPHI|nr:hypothetical protein SAMN05192578_101575 [Sphingobacterium mizutaii]SNV49109.1 Uncharacterised protein [Sphingobacterium mizutaii]
MLENDIFNFSSIPNIRFDNKIWKQLFFPEIPQTKAIRIIRAKIKLIARLKTNNIF